MTTTALSPGRYAWIVVALLFPVALLNYLDRQMIAAMKVSVMGSVSEIALESQWGYMLGQFKWVYALFSPIGGYMADRFSRRWTIGGSLIAWSLVTWLTGHVTTYQGLLWTRTAMGLSEAFNFTGLIGILYSIPLLLLLRDPQRSADGRGQSGGRSRFRELLTNRSFLLLVLYFTLPALAGWIVRDWMPAILQQSFNISQGLAGVSATLYWQSAAIVAAFAGGWMADRWMKCTDRGRIYVSAIGMALIIPALFGVGNSPNLGSFGLAVFSLVLFGAGWGFFDTNNMPILCQITRPDLRATGYGIMNFVSISCGGLADWGFGHMRDLRVPLNVIFGVFASACVVSVALVLLIRPRHTGG